MKRLKLVVGVVALLAAVTVYANRTDVWLLSSARVDLVHTWTLPDGGCAIQAVGTYLKSDGGSVTEDSRVQELSGANRTSCLDVQTKALLLFTTDKAL